MHLHLEQLPRWCWIVLGAIVGAVLAYQQPPRDWRSAMDNLEDQRRFESMLLKSDAHGSRFRDLVVHPAEFDPARRQMVYPITGRYAFAENAAPHAISFRAPQPYQPVTDLSRLVVAGQQVPQVLNVHQFLSLAQHTSGITWRYAWWELPGLLPALYISAGVMAIGLLWPTVIYLIVFRSFRRPAGAATVSLWNVRSRTAPPRTAPASVDLQAVEALDAELEAALASQAIPAAPPAAAVPAAEIKRLTPTPAAPSAPPREHEQIDYAARPDDFYPTARKPAKEHA